MPKKAGIVFVAMGAVLILSALLLFLHNDAENVQAGQQAEAMLQDVQSVISQRNEDSEDNPKPKPEHPVPTEGLEETEPRPTELPIVMIQGYEYIGYLTIPDLEIELPVMADWDYARLQIAPCRQFGSPLTDDLVIAAHNYPNHFGRLSSLKPGDEVIFTDMDGYEDHYELVRVETLQPTAVDEVQNSGHDLVLYTCTYGGASRIVAFFDRS